MDESRIAKQFKTKDTRKWADFKASYLSFHWLNDSWTHEFELVSCGFELITCGIELISHVFELRAHRFELLAGRFELVTRGFKLVTCEYKLVTHKV